MFKKLIVGYGIFVSGGVLHFMAQNAFYKFAYACARNDRERNFWGHNTVDTNDSPLVQQAFIHLFWPFRYAFFMLVKWIRPDIIKKEVHMFSENFYALKAKPDSEQ